MAKGMDKRKRDEKKPKKQKPKTNASAPSTKMSSRRPLLPRANDHCGVAARLTVSVADHKRA